jgi:hypothetical protein
MYVSKQKEIIKMSEDTPFAVTSMSDGDEIKRVELLEEAICENDNQLAIKILALVDPACYDILDGELWMGSYVNEH